MSENGNGNSERNNGDGGSSGTNDFEIWEKEIKQYKTRHAKLRERQRRNNIHNVVKSSRSTKEPTWADIRRSSTVSDDLLFGMFASNKALEVVNLIESKHRDYGSAGILEAPFGPIPSLITRLHDKIARAANLSELGGEPNHESLRETFLDIAGYGLIGLMVLDKQFPEE